MLTLAIAAIQFLRVLAELPRRLAVRVIWFVFVIGFIRPMQTEHRRTPFTTD